MAQTAPWFPLALYMDIMELDFSFEMWCDDCCFSLFAMCDELGVLISDSKVGANFQMCGVNVNRLIGISDTTTIKIEMLFN